MKWLNKGNSTLNHPNQNLQTNKSNALFKNENHTFTNMADNFYNNQLMTSSTDNALVSSSTRYRESHRKNMMNLREFSHPNNWTKDEDSAAEIIINKPNKTNPLQAVNNKVHLVQRSYKHETLEERRQRLKLYAMRKEKGYSMITTS